MDLTNVGDFLSIIDSLPTNWKIAFTVIFFLVPRIIQTLGGGKVLRKVWGFFVEVLRNYQARKQREVEDEGLTEAYTRTLVVESLQLFNQRLQILEEKIDLALSLLDRDEG